MTKSFAELSYSTQRMIVASLIDKRAALELKDGRGLSIEIRGCATEIGREGKDSSFQSDLVAADFVTGDLMVIRLRDIASLQEQELPITDRRHPDWEDPGRVVRPAKKRAR